MKTLKGSRLSSGHLSKKINVQPEVDVPISVTEYANNAMKEVSTITDIEILPQSKVELPKLQFSDRMYAESPAMKKLLMAMANTRPPGKKE
jgi:hypothetical protein